MKTVPVPAISMAVVVAAAILLGCGMVVPAESRALLTLDLGKLIDHWIDCPPPPGDEDLPEAPEPYAAPYDIPPEVMSPAPSADEPPSPEYQSPPGPPYADIPPPVYEPSPEYPTPPAIGY